MRIGIVTFWDSLDNYGQQLQLFALSETLVKMGHYPFLIRYDRHREPIKRHYSKLINPLFVIRKVFGLFQKKTVVKPAIVQQPSRRFDEFRRLFINQTPRTYTIKELRNEAPLADVYISGSDQVWREDNPADFLDFGPDSIKRISYAASFGVDSFSKESMKKKKKFLRRFQHISVREEDGLDICKQMGYEKAVCVLDPTLLFDFNYYKTKFNLVETTPPKKYIFLYLLGDVLGTNVDQIVGFAAENGLEVKYADTHGQNNSYPKIYPSAIEWLNLVLNSEMVITNSFHGTAFSVILHKKFCSIRKGESDGRIYTLLNKVNLADHIYDSNFKYCLETDIDYSDVEKRLEVFRQYSLNYLENALIG